jgi:hypothetical protein
VIIPARDVSVRILIALLAIHHLIGYLWVVYANLLMGTMKMEHKYARVGLLFIFIV